MPKTTYAVRKRCGQWAVWSDDDVCLNFQSYDDAIATARSAAIVLSHEPADPRKDEARPLTS